MDFTSVRTKLIGGVIIFSAIFSAGYTIGWYREHINLVKYTAQVEQAGRNQNILTKQKEIENEQQVVNVANAYSADILRLRDNVTRMQNNRTSSGGLPKTTTYTEGVYTTQQELYGACADTEFYSNGLEDALMIESIREYFMRLQFPVKE